MSNESLASRLTVSASMPRLDIGSSQHVKVGFLGPLTGDVSAWGKPGLDGRMIWADWINAAGGLALGGR